MAFITTVDPSAMTRSMTRPIKEMDLVESFGW
jgi:hypothetical protein